MQERQRNRRQYFNELAATSTKYFFPYVNRFKKIEPGMNVIEIGCGDGGNLIPFFEAGCKTIGVDIAEGRIRDAISFFKEKEGDKEGWQFIASDAFKIQGFNKNFDLVICHDCIEHILDKEGFLKKTEALLKDNGVIFMSFPAWQMPFGGHQQICRNKLLSHLPWMHLLPKPIYKIILKGGEDDGCIKELMSIWQTRCPIEVFEAVLRKTNLKIANKIHFFINPHYEVKFGLKPRVLNKLIAHIPYIRNFFTTSSFYILSK